MDTVIHETTDQVAERVATRVRDALARAGHEGGLDGAVETARDAMISADTVSLFGMATEHPEHGPVHWLVGQSTGAEQGFVVLALTAGEEKGPHGLHTASAADLSEALMQLAPELAAPVETEPLRA